MQRICQLILKSSFFHNLAGNYKILVPFFARFAQPSDARGRRREVGGAAMRSGAYVWTWKVPQMQLLATVFLSFLFAFSFTLLLLFWLFSPSSSSFFSHRKQKAALLECSFILMPHFTPCGGGGGLVGGHFEGACHCARFVRLFVCISAVASASL